MRYSSMRDKRWDLICAVALVLASGFLARLALAALPPAPASGLDHLPDAGICDNVGTAAWSIEPGCDSCTTVNAALASDGKTQTYASFTAGKSLKRSGAALIRVTAAPGKVFPAGTAAYLLVHEPVFPPGVQIVYSETLRTYLNGQPQEQDEFFSGTLGASSDGELSKSIAATKPFDAVEYRIFVTKNATAQRWDVLEMCNNFNGETP